MNLVRKSFCKMLHKRKYQWYNVPVPLKRETVYLLRILKHMLEMSSMGMNTRVSKTLKRGSDAFDTVIRMSFATSCIRCQSTSPLLKMLA
jgi:hypothetical protein